MTDNIRTTPFDKVLAADEIDLVKHLKVKLEYGDNNSVTQVSELNPLPVALNAPITISDSSLTLSIPNPMTVSSGTVPLSVTFTNTDITANPTGTYTVSGNVTSSPSGTYTVSGNVTSSPSGTYTVGGSVAANPTGTYTVSGIVTANPSGTYTVGGSVTANPSVSSINDFNFQLGRSLAGVSDIVTIAMEAQSPNVSVYADFSWFEII